MIALREVLVRPGIIDSERVCALPLACQLFFRNLLHACDGAARFPADPDELRAAFYWRSPGVSRPHVESWLQRLHRDRLVKLYTRGGRPYGELINYGQKDHRRKVLYPPPDDGELNFAAPEVPQPVAPRATDRGDPPWLPQEEELNGREGKRPRRAKPNPPPAPHAAAQLCPNTVIERLKREWPHVDVMAELLKADALKRKQGQNGVDLAWFEKHWLPQIGPVVSFASAANPGAPTVEPEPEAWRVYLRDEYEAESWAESAAACTWESMPRHYRDKINREMRERGLWRAAS